MKNNLFVLSLVSGGQKIKIIRKSNSLIKAKLIVREKARKNGHLLASGYMYNQEGYVNCSDFSDVHFLKQTILNYDGMYLCIQTNKIGDKYNIEFFTDAFGLEQLYFYQKNDDIHLSNDINYLSDTLKNELLYSIDPDTLKDWLVMGYCLNNSTPVKNVKKVEPGKFYSFFNKKLSNEVVYSVEEKFCELNMLNKSKNDKTLYEEYDDILKTNIANYLENNNKSIGAYLSSGLDSRTNAYALDSLGVNFMGVTYDCAEVEDNIASLEYGAILKNIIVNCFISDNVDEAVNNLNIAAEIHGYSQPSNHFQFYAHSKFLSKNIDSIFDGASGDVFMGTMYEPYKYTNLNFFYEKFISTGGALSSLLNNKESFFEVIGNYEATGNYQKIFLFNVLNRQRNWVLPGLRSLYKFSEPFATPYNKNNIEFCFRLNGRQLSDRSFHRSFLRHQSSKFSNITSPNFGSGLDNSKFEIFFKKVVNKLGYKNKFLNNDYQYTYSNREGQYIYVIDKLIKETTYEFVSDLYKVNINSLKALRNSQKAYLLNLQYNLKL
jgi:hypothetical protein